MDFSLATCVGALSIIAESAEAEELGMPKADFMVLNGSRPWKGAQRAAVVRSLEAYIYGGMDAQGIGALEVSAEFAAAAVFAVVHPVNMRRACFWLPARNSSEAMLLGSEDRVSAERLAIMVSHIKAWDLGQDTQFKEMFEVSMRKKYKLSLVKGERHEK